MTRVPEAAPAAEHLKSYVQEILGMFQTGAGIYDGVPLPMTFELAVKSIWREIDRTLYHEWPRDSERRVALRIQGKGSLPNLLQLLTNYGTWTMRASRRGGGGEDEVTVAHVVGMLSNPKNGVPLLEVLALQGWSTSDITFGVL